MTRCKNNATLLGDADAGRRPAVAGVAALAHLDKHRGAIGRSHDQVDFAAAAPGRPIITLQQAQTCLLQMAQRGLFGRIACLFAGPDFGINLRKYH